MEVSTRIIPFPSAFAQRRQAAQTNRAIGQGMAESRIGNSSNGKKRNTLFEAGCQVMFRILGQTQETAGVRTYRLTPAA